MQRYGYGFASPLIEGFENIPVFNTLYNYPYYNDYVQRLGYAKECDWIENKIVANQGAPEKVRRYDAAVLRLCGLRAGDSLPYQAFAALVEQRILEAGRRDEICGDCCWDAICRKKQEERSNG